MAGQRRSRGRVVAEKTGAKGASDPDGQASDQTLRLTMTENPPPVNQATGLASSSGVVVLGGAGRGRAVEQDRALGVAHHLFGDAPEEPSLDAGAAMRRHDDHIALARRRDDLPRDRAVEHVAGDGQAPVGNSFTFSPR